MCEIIKSVKSSQDFYPLMFNVANTNEPVAKWHTYKRVRELVFKTDHQLAREMTLLTL